MISYIKGSLTQVTQDSIILECQNIGYEIKVSSSWLLKLSPNGQELKVYTYLQVREDGITLYGFKQPNERMVYLSLTSVSGVGPKAAMGILSTMDLDELSLAIATEDAKAIAKAPGIGLKTAKKVILELKDKMNLEDILESIGENSESMNGMDSLNTSAKAEAMEGLISLGYSSQEAAKALKKINIHEQMSVEEILKLALKAIL